MPGIKKPGTKPPNPGTTAGRRPVQPNKTKAARPRRRPAPSDYLDQIAGSASPGAPAPNRARGLQPPTASTSQAANPAEALSLRGQVLFQFVGSRPNAVFDTVTFGESISPTGASLTFSAPERLEVLETLLSRRPAGTLNARNKRGDTLAHGALLNGFLPSPDKSELLTGLARLGANLNQPNSEGDPPLELALRLQPLDPTLIGTLQGLGARFSTASRLAVIASLAGIGGSVPHPSISGKRVPLEGLSPQHGTYALDPIFRDALRDVAPAITPAMQGPLGDALKSWSDTSRFDDLLLALGTLRSAPPGSLDQPEFLVTGWDHPNGHAVSFVLSPEGDGTFLYACNTGDAKDNHRSIVKYEVTNPTEAAQFFETCAENRDHVRELFVNGPTGMGITRCEESEQIPAGVDKASQKRGNCPVASRKAGLLALLWSSSRADNVPPEEVKGEYKKVTTELRRVGVSRILAGKSLPLQGKALVSMLTKFDRPPCKQLAWELADAILGGSNPRTPDTLGAALKESGQNLGKHTNANGRSLVMQAKHRGNPEAEAILRQLTPKIKRTMKTKKGKQKT